MSVDLAFHSSNGHPWGNLNQVAAAKAPPHWLKINSLPAGPGNRRPPQCLNERSARFKRHMASIDIYIIDFDVLFDRSGNDILGHDPSEFIVCIRVRICAFKHNDEVHVGLKFLPKVTIIFE